MIRTSKYGSVKVTGTDLVTTDGEVIEILEDAVFTTINEAGITTPITSHNVAGVQSAGERIFAHTKFTGVQLASGSVRIGGFRRRKIAGLAGAIKNAFILWLYGRPFHDQYVTDKHGQQDRELLSGEIFPGRGYDGDQTNYITLGTDIVFADDTSWAVSCFVEWDVIAQYDSIFGNVLTATNYTRFWKDVNGTDYVFTNEANGRATWTITIPTVRHHVLIQNDGTDTNNLELFIDGVSEGTKTLANTEIVIAEFMTMGGGNAPLDGTIDDIRVYSRILNSDEIASLQTKEALGDELLWYPCEDVTDGDCFDASGNANHGSKVSWLSANNIEGPWQSLMNKYGYNQDVTYEEVPPDMSSGTVPTLDALGNALVYAGQAQYHGISVEAGSFIGDGVAYFTITGLLTTDTIEVEVGSDTPTCTSDNRLDIADGDEVYGVTIKRASVVWAIIPFCEGAGTTAYDVSGNDNHATGTNVDETNWGTQDDFHYLRDYGMSTLGANLVSNGGTPETTDWVDTDENGVADNWTIIGTGSIVTGNGFTGNAQRLLNINGSGDRIQTITSFIIGKTYRIRFKYRTSSVAVSMQQGFSGAPDPTIATGDAIQYDEIYTCVTASTGWMRINGIGEYFEVDEFYVQEIDQIIPALADKSADAIGSAIQYPQNGANVLPETYFKLPENIAELLAADLETRWGVEIATGNLTIGETYLITARDDADFTADGSADNNVGTEFIATGTSVTLDSGDRVRQKQIQVGNNFITDGEGFKWRDDNSDGIGNGWQHYTGAGVPAIVTGNGFAGNAQKIDHVNGTITTFRYRTYVNAVSGQTYRITFKYRADSTGFKIILRYNSDYFTSTIPVNTGDATEISYDIEATGTTEIILTFRADSAAANQYIEVDEVELRPVIPSFFYEPLVLGGDPVVIKTNDLPDYRYLTQYYNSTNRKDLILLEAGHSLDGDDHNKLLKFTKNN